MSRNLRGPPPSWKDLPSDLLVTISDLVDPETDVCNLRAVCKKWRSTVPPPPLYLHPELPYTITSLPRYSLPLPFTSFKRPITIVPSTVFLLRHTTTTKDSTPWLVAVEQSTLDKVRLCHPLTRIPITNVPENFPQGISSKFSALEISKGFSLRTSDGLKNALKQDKFEPSKVIYWSDPDSAVTELCKCRVMLLHNWGLVCLTFDNNFKCLGWSPIKHGHTYRFHDIIKWKGMILALDGVGRLYGIEFKTLKAIAVIVNARTFPKRSHKHLRLLASDDGVFLIIRKRCKRSCGAQFEVYKLAMNSHVWKRAENIGDRISFVSFDTCFFVDSKDFLPGLQGNCVVFPKDCIPSDKECRCDDGELFQGASGYFEIGVCYLGESNFKLVSSVPGFSDVLWPPPLWLWDCNMEAEQRTECEPEGTGMELRSSIGDRTGSNTALKEISSSGPAVQPCAKQVSKVKFPGLHIKDDLKPVLEAIWAKHGSVIGDDTIRSETILASSLETLAKVVTILQESTGRTLTDSQANYINSVMYDLGCVRLKVEWLSPIVEKALELHRSKPLMESLAALHKEKEEAVESEKKFLAESAWKKKELEERIATLSARIPFAEPAILDECLGNQLC